MRRAFCFTAYCTAASLRIRYLQPYASGCIKKRTFFSCRQTPGFGKLTGDASVSQILSEPNNILGIEYLKALKKQNSRMVPYTLKRDSSGYHDTKLQPQSSSASAIRNALRHWEEQPFSRYPADPQQTPDDLRTVAEPAS